MPAKSATMAKKRSGGLLDNVLYKIAPDNTVSVIDTGPIRS